MHLLALLQEVSDYSQLLVLAGSLGQEVDVVDYVLVLLRYWRVHVGSNFTHISAQVVDFLLEMN
jgi:hypothetical protein